MCEKTARRDLRGGGRETGRPTSIAFKKNMKFQLVLQFANVTDDDFDDLVDLEDKIESQLQDEHDVDGHDFGNDEFNIFILTDYPREASLEIRNILSKFYSSQFVIAFRALSEEKYNVVWPENYFGHFKVS